MTEIETEFMWKHLWPCSEILCEFIANNQKLWKGKTILEIGSGVAALPSMTAIRCGALKVIITEQTRLKKSFELIRLNLEKNFDATQIDNCVRIMGFDWNEPQTAITNLLNETTTLDYIFGSDVFYDPSVFELLIHNVLRPIINHFPLLEFYFAYQIRDSDWTIEELLTINGLQCSLIRCVDTKIHSICLGKINKRHNWQNKLLTMTENDSMLEGDSQNERLLFAGIEGGATHSTMVFIDSMGNKIGQWNDGPGLNCLLNGVERTADQIANWVRAAATECEKANLPLASVGMGLSGAEDEATNNRMLEYMKAEHADLTDTFMLTTDSVTAVATSFDNGGIVLIAGTGSTCRLLKANGDVHGVGGWGHLIGDGGSGFWITMRAVRRIFDFEDGFLDDNDEIHVNFEIQLQRLAAVKAKILEHFKVSDKLGLLDILYNPNFTKSFVASFCKRLAFLADNGDEFAKELFADAGAILARHVASISLHFDSKMFEEIPIVLIGSVFKSWSHLKIGFEEYLKKRNGLESNGEKQIRRITFYELDSSPAIGAAILGSRLVKKGVKMEIFKKLQSRKFIDVISF